MSEKFFSKHFRIEKVNEGLYVAIAKEGGGAVANAGIVDLGDQTIVFDTFNTQQAAEDLKSIAESITNCPVSWVINSHWHGDHIRGNQVFKDSCIISSQITYEKMKENHPSRINHQKNDILGLKEYIESLNKKFNQTNDISLENQINFLREIEASLPTLELTLPQLAFKNEINFYGSKRSAKLCTLGGGHSFCDSFLYIPEDKVIFMGDLLFVDCHPSFFDETDLEKWIHILQMIENMAIEVAIPGHGPIGTKIDLQKVINYINEKTIVAHENNQIEK
ncbi:MBL fold metallo-hydrolase [Heyndrickxia sp. NPDC080065]|uniref:MBL fold metallo-hydrolase n=1 Tax=Heyndrickxia sp. NPDC080065 TaxID=3390568 RepID=UPI003CFEFA8B